MCRWKRVQRESPYQLMQNLEKVAKVHCRGDDCAYDWGIVVRYMPTGRHFPVLKLDSFFLEHAATGDKLSGKIKWSKAPFHVPAISQQELK